MEESTTNNETGGGATNFVPTWLREAQILASTYHLDQITDAVEALKRARVRHRFRVVVVGEFNRGKSTLINRLIERDLLPTGPLPVTRAAVIISAGPDDSVRIAWADGRREDRKVSSADVWRDLVGRRHAPPDAPSPVVQGGRQPVVTASVSSEWLNGLDVELVDTAGVNSGSPEQFEEVRRTVSVSDAALFTLSAVSPLSATERQLLEEEVLCRHLPLTAVVLTMIDLIPPEDHDEVIKALHARLAELPGNIPVLVAPVPGGGDAEVAELRSVIESFAHSDERAHWRNLQTAVQLAQYCDAMARTATEGEVARTLTSAERAERSAGEAALLETESREWDRLRLEMTARQLTSSERLRKSIAQRRVKLTEDLRWELDRASDPRAWWQRDLPVLLRRGFAAIAQDEERLILSAINHDATWLDGEVTRHFPVADATAVPGRLGLTADPRISGDVADLARTRLAARVAVGGGAIVAAILANARHARMPMIYATGFSLIGGLLAEASLRSATQQQREQVCNVLVEVIDQSAGEFGERATDALAEHYAEMVDQLQETHVAWRMARLAALTADESGDDPDWTTLAIKATSLAERIRSGFHI
jgi:GTPase SAR1 family protein